MSKITSRVIKNYKSIGLNLNDIMDVNSVKYGIRNYNLLHIKKKHETKLSKIIRSLSLNIVDKRKLYLYKDKKTHEHLLFSKEKKNEKYHSIISEVWISKKKKIPNSNHKQSGNFLGYPKCCVKYYIGKNTLNNHYQRYLNQKNLNWKLNRLVSIFNLPFFMPDYFPCSLNCKKAINLSNKYLRLAKKIFPKSIFLKIINHQKSPLLIFNGKIFHFNKWKFEKKNKIILYLKDCKVRNLSKIINKKVNNKVLTDIKNLKLKIVALSKDKKKIKIKL